MGYLKTLQRVSEMVAWKTLKKDVKTFVRDCAVRQANKYESIAPPGFLQPNPIPAGIFEDLSMDFICSLPTSGGGNALLVVIDRLSKYANFSALNHLYFTKSIAAIFLQDVIKLHGIPRSIISDRDLVFISSFWTELFRLCDTKLKRSTAYHPQIDGQTEVVNRCVQMFLRCFVGFKTKTWITWLP